MGGHPMQWMHRIVHFCEILCANIEKYGFLSIAVQI